MSEENSSLQLVKDLTFCVIDLETTGGNHHKDKIIEVGMVKVKNLEVVDSKSFLVNPETQIPEFIQKLTRISQNDVKDAPVISDIIDEILEFISDDIIVAHNTSFDVPFLNGVLKRLGKDELKNNVICTNVMTKHLIPDILNSNLNYMSRIFNINHTKAHRAYDDALATARLLIKYLNIFADKGIKKINQLYYPRNKFELDRTHFDEDSSIQEMIEFLKTKNQNLVATVKGERGLILAVIPLNNPAEETDFFNDILNDLDWKIVTFKMTKPEIEGIFQFNNHLKKYPEQTKNKILTYLKSKYASENEKPNLHNIDFIVAHHLIADQVACYSFLHLNTNTKHLFKIPAQKKKLYQFLLSQITKFEGKQKGRRSLLLHEEVKELLEIFLAYHKGSNKHYFLTRKNIKADKDSTISEIESYVDSRVLQNDFPNQHL